MSNIYIHKKTGKRYELINDHILFKDLNESGDDYYWRGKYNDKLVLYKALYDNPDGKFFVRHADDFYDSFEREDEEIHCTRCGWCGKPFTYKPVDVHTFNFDEWVQCPCCRSEVFL